jgi:large subunit ribosomal protein L20
MPRVRSGAARHQKHKRTLKAARGMFGSASRRYKIAKQAVFRAGVYATRDRKNRKREFRKLWITRISAACEMRGTKYSRFICGLEDAGIKLNRKMLSEIAIADPAAFDKLVEAALAAMINKQPPAPAAAAE